MWCFKCNKAVEAETQEVVLKNGRHAAKGKCPNCGTALFKLVKSHAS